MVLRVLSASLFLLASSCAEIWGFDDARDGDAGADDASRTDAAHASDATDDRSKPPVDLDARPVDDVRPDTPATSEARADAVSAPTCTPACTFGGACESAVGGTDVCVSSFSCTDSSECFGSGCCVWTDPTSATGRCESTAAGPASKVSCLCTKPATGMGMNDCKKCAAPPGDPSAPVTVCQT